MGPVICQVTVTAILDGKERVVKNLHVFLVVNMMGFVQHQIPVTAILDGPEIVVAFVSLTSLSSDTYSI